LPLGLQLIGRPFEEESLFSVARVIEDSAPKTVLPARWW
jgi:aspartyl-tRNA(Asn)/glutamyl-tRNA(Gln) amidotransferase subunit A